MSRKPSKPETRIEDYLDVMTGGNASLPQPILRIEFYYAFLAGMAVELPEPILDDEKLLAKICGMEVEAPTYIPGISPRLYAYMAKEGGQDVEITQPVTREEMYWFDYCGGTPTPPEREYTGAVPVTFVADGTPLLDYIISGSTVQSGTPTPDSPITPQGTGERTGNLLSEKYENRSINGSGAFTVDNNFDLWVGEVVAGQIYTISNMNSVYGFFTAKPLPNTGVTYDGSRGIEISGTAVVTVPSGCTWIAVRVLHNADNAMLNTGSTALPYEPYGYKIPISSANITTPVYLGEVQTTRKIKKLVLTGEETIDRADNCFRIPLPLSSASIPNAVSTHLPFKAGWELRSGATGICTSATYYGTNYKYLLIRCDEIATTTTNFKTYLQQQYAAGTPVTVWYVLAEPQTGIVNEPLMKIGDYTDTLSMEQAGAQIPTANGSTTLDVETTVKPSEVYIKYRGEAAATLSTLSAEVSSQEANEEVNPEETEEEENER